MFIFYLPLSRALYVGAAPSYSYFSFRNIVNNEWFNATLLFVIFFLFILFALNKFIKPYASAVIASLAIALIASFSIIYAYGNILTNKYVVIGMIILVIAWIFSLIFRFGGKLFLVVLFVLALLGLFAAFFVCPPYVSICDVVKSISLSLLFIFILLLVFWLLFLLIRKMFTLPNPIREPKLPVKQPVGPQPSKPFPPADTKRALALARRIGLANLQRELKQLAELYRETYKKLQEGYKKAAKLHAEATRAGWTKTEKGRQLYKAWYRQYTQNGVLQEELKKIKSKIADVRTRIKHLQSKL